MLSNKVKHKHINKLPIYNYQNEIINRLNKENILLLIGETGCGKTTQVPQILYKNKLNNDKCICITQPRRVAAISIAHRVSQELNSQIGQTVGYSVRFEEKFSQNTRIKYVTDGMLLRETMIDSKLSKYSIIILDEAHERSLNSDILLALIKIILNQRRLKLVIMSATLDVDKFSNYLGSNNIIHVQGRSFPIEVYNVLEEQKNYIDSVMLTLLQIHNSDEDDDFKHGDILAFLPGQEDIEDLQELLNQKVDKFNYKYEVFPLYSAMPNQEQLKIFNPLENKRKIILATNIAETSLTIRNIKYVIDTGFCKLRNYISKTGIDTLQVTKISKNSAIQRSGRAGRDSKGKCFRLYTENEFVNMDDFTPPEIQRVNLKNLVLHLKNLNLDPLNFDFIDRPPKENFLKALDELKMYKALDSFNNLTDLGKKMCVLPVEPIFSKILINSLSPDFNKVKDEILTIISVLQTDNIFFTPSVVKEKAEKIREKFINQLSDHLTMLNVFNQWKENRSNKNWAKEHFLNEKSLKKADDIKKQLKGYLEKIDNKVESDLDKYESILNEIYENKNDKNEKEDLIIKCLLTGYFTNIARYSSNNYFTTLREKILCKVHPTSILIKNPKLGKNYEYVIYNDLMVTNKHYIKCCSLIKSDLIKKYL